MNLLIVFTLWLKRYRSFQTLLIIFSLLLDWNSAAFVIIFYKLTDFLPYKFQGPTLVNWVTFKCLVATLLAWFFLGKPKTFPNESLYDLTLFDVFRVFLLITFAYIGLTLWLKHNRINSYRGFGHQIYFLRPLGVFILSITDALLKQIYFHYFVYGYYRDLYAVELSQVVTAVIFGLIAGKGWGGRLAYFMLSILQLLIYELHHSLYLNCLTHSLINLIALYLMRKQMQPHKIKI